MANELQWHEVCDADELEMEDVVEFENGGNVYAVYRIKSGCYATGGLCPHEQARLADGLVTGEFVECPKHNSRFHIPTGKVKKVPAREDLATYPVREENGKLYIGLEG
ncbi:MAG: non-heme iron oxygenase ferredoxin subunit [Spirochaetales bacterium]|nr:non-heme iron oxygenase ferredoxin subunit [Spirochaetales bacterium]MCF7939601.1 non-heme iron oxygenase ferredoxin subunit [Spirochaetales bacterium]